MKKIIVSVIIVCTIIIMIMSVCKDIARKNEWVNNREVIYVHVYSGDSIDKYWGQYAPSWLDRRQYRYDFMELNGRASCDLYAGETIALYTMKGE